MFFFVFIANVLSSCFRSLSDVWFVTIVALACLLGVGYNVRTENLVFFPSPEQKTWDEMQSVMQRKKRPQIMVMADNGYGLLVKALPACKYWAMQFNSSDAMLENRHKALKEEKPDFVIVLAKYKIENIDTLFYPVLHESGYRQCYVTVMVNGKTMKKAMPIYERSK